MPSAAALRLQIETALAPRIPGALTPRPQVVRDQAASGIPELDVLLEGGFPIGAITELVGAQSSGRTTLALAAMAETTQAGKTVAWVDATDALDPESAAAAGVDLARQLWVRCGRAARQAQSVAENTSPARAGSREGAALLVEGSRIPAPSGGCGSPHPRGEARGLSEAIDAFLHPDVFSRPAPPRDPAIPRKNRMVGTPSAPNRKLTDRTPQDARPMPRRARDREEQIPTDRQPSRRQALEAQQRHTVREPRHLGAAQIANTAAAAAERPRAGAWTDNRNNAHGRSLATPPNAIAAGLPRFREMEARAAGQGHGLPQGPYQWKPSLDRLMRPPASVPDTPSDTPESFTGQPLAPVPLPGNTAQVQPMRAFKKPAALHAPLTILPGSSAEKLKKPKRHSLAGDPPPSLRKRSSPLWQALDQALRATDLLLSAGGFSIVVLDLGDVPAEFAWRIPLATWFRFRAAADRARTVLLLLTQHACARSSAGLTLRLSPLHLEAAGTVLTGAQFLVSVDRRRFETQPPPEPPRPEQAQKLHLVPPRKQPQRERAAGWHRAASWTGTEPGPHFPQPGSRREGQR